MTRIDLADLYLEVVPKAMRTFRVELAKGRSSVLTLPQYRILAYLRQGPANNRTLAEQHGVSVAAMSRMVDWLCRHDLVERLSDRADRRQVHLRLTVAGRQRIENFSKQAKRRMEKRFAELSGAQRVALAKGLTALASALKSLNG